MANLTLKHIYKVYPNGAKAVNDFTMDIDDKEFIVFVGPSGCGKSTTLRMIAGLEDITAGELYIDNKYVNITEPKNRDIAMVFQNYALYPHMTVYENIAFGLKLRKVNKEEIDKRVNAAAEMLGLTDYLKRKPGEMSGGQRQRVALGRALVREPKVFLLDEPLSNLDAKLRASMRSEISRLHDRLQNTFIYVTHDQVEAMTMGDRIVVMKDGFIQQIATPKNLYRYPNNKFVAGFIGTPQMNFFDVTLKENGKDVDVHFTKVDVTISIPRDYLLNVDPSYFDGTKPVIFGIRSENVSLNPNQYPYKVKCIVSQLEELGTETLVYADLDTSKDLLALNDDEKSSTAITLKASADYESRTGKVIEISIDFKQGHFFDANSEKVINPHMPSISRVSLNKENNKFTLLKEDIEVVDALKKVEDGTYNVIIPTESIKVCQKGQFKEKIFDVIKLDDNHSHIIIKRGLEILHINVDHSLLKEEFNKGDTISFDIDLKQISFYKGDELYLDKFNMINTLSGELSYRKEKTEDKYNKVLLYCVEGKNFDCYNKTAHRSFIETKDKSVFDLYISYRFSPYEIRISEAGQLDGEVLDIIDFNKEKFAKVKINDKEIFVYIDQSINVGDKLKLELDIDKIKVFDAKKDIRLV